MLYKFSGIIEKKMNGNNLFSLLKVSWLRSSWKLIVLIIICFFSSVLELIGIGLVVPLINLSFNQGSQNSEGIMIFFQNFFNYLSLEISLNLILFIILIVFISKSLLVFFGDIIRIWITTGVRKSVQNQIISLYNNVNFKYFISKRAGEHSNLIIRECERYQTLLNNVTQLMISLISILIFSSSIIFLDFQVLVFMSIIFFITLIFVIPIINKTKIFSKSNVELYSDLNSGLIDLVKNYSYLKGTENIKRFISVIKSRIDGILKINRALGVFSSLLTNLKEPTGVIIVVCLIFYKVSFQQAPLEDVIVLSFVLYRTAQRILDIQNNWQRIHECSAGVFFAEETIKELANNAEPIGKKKTVDFKNVLKFEDVTFGYNKKNIFTKINIKIYPKSILVLYGKSGIGKTTFVNLIMKLLIPDSGKILFGKTDYNQINSEKIREKIGYVSQDLVLFKGTIRENVAFWNQELMKDTQKITECMKLASCDDLIERLDENVGDQGLKLSGGQKQRIIIAREIFKNPSILILDEPTSALDKKNRTNIKNSLMKLRVKFRIIVITHQKLFLKIGDQTLRLDEFK